MGVRSRGAIPLLAALLLCARAHPLVTDLDSASFEHQTQAATGQTTGTWFVLFTSSVEPSLTHLSEGLWEEVAASAREAGARAIFARVDLAREHDLAERFGGSAPPAFVLFRDRQMYKYGGAEPSVEGLRAFLEGGYRGVAPTAVPLPATSLDNFLRLCGKLVTREGLLLLGAVLVAFMAVLEAMRRLGLGEQPEAVLAAGGQPPARRLEQPAASGSSEPGEPVRKRKVVRD